MPRIRKTAIAAGVLAAALVLVGCSGADDEVDDRITLRYAFFAPGASFPALQMEEWGRQLTERTEGQVEVELFVGGTLLGAGDIYEGVSQGVVEVGLDAPAYDTKRFPLSSVINVPMGLTDPAVASQTFLQLITEFNPDEYSAYEVITAFTTEASYLQTLKPVAKQSDLAGTTLRGTAASIPLLEELGTSPVGLPMNDVSEQLSTGVIDGYASSREVLKDFGLAETVRYVTNFPLGINNSFVAVMDKAKFESLPENVQAAIHELRQEMSDYAAEIHAEGIAAASAFAEEQGVQTVDLDAEELKAWQSISDLQGDAWVAAHRSSSFDAQGVLDRAKEIAAANGNEIDQAKP